MVPAPRSDEFRAEARRQAEAVLRSPDQREDQAFVDAISDVAQPVEIYSLERKAEFLLSNAVDAEDYREAVEAVREMGLDAELIEHRRPDQLPR